MNAMRRGTCILLCLGLLLAALPVMLPVFTSATSADDQEEALLGTLSQKFEASGPGTISSGSDAGGKSYGAYQFSSRSDIPRSFFRWCQSSSDTYYRSIGNRLSDAYEADGGYGSTFDSTWKALAREDGDGFLRVQRNYVRRSYYEPIVRAVEEAVSGFDMDNYSIALRNVFWSRAVQHGVGGASGYSSADGRGGATGVILRAFDALGGFANQPEAELIEAIYQESGAVCAPREDSAGVMSGPTAEKYGISGMVLKYYDGNSGDIQLGVYTRLRVNEPAKAQGMLAKYGFEDAPLDEGVYQLRSSVNSKLAVAYGSSGLTLVTAGEDESQQFRLDYHASGYYTITCVSNGLRLAASSKGSAYLTEPTSGKSQLWQAEAVNSGFSLRNRYTGTYLSVGSNSVGGKLLMSDTPQQWQLTLAHSGWTLEGASYPTVNSSLTVGQSGFPLRGILRSSYTIRSVRVSVLGSSGKNAITPASAAPSAKSYDLSLLDDSVAFSRLGAGGYTLLIEAENSNGSSYRLESRFYVTDGSYVVSFDPCGGSCPEDTRLVSAGQKYGELPTAVKEGYAFVGWFTQLEGGQQITADMTTTANNITLYARYQRQYTYRFLNYDGSTFAEGRLTAGQRIPQPAKKPSRPADDTCSYRFTGWEGYEEGQRISGDVTFAALFEARPLEEVPAEISTSVYIIRDGYLRAIPAGTTAAELRAGLSPAAWIRIGVPDDKPVGSGTSVTYIRDGETIQSLTAVVTGDLSGDGRVSITDIVRLQSHLLERDVLRGAALSAADLNGDGQVSITDMVRLQSYLLGRSELQPN